MNLSLHEKFEKVGKEKSIKKKQGLLREYDTPGFRAILRSTYDETIQWIVPDSRPPFELNDAPDFDLVGVSLENEALKIGRFVLVNGQVPQQGVGLKKVKREQLFIQLLESLHSTEAELLLNMVRGRLPYKGLTVGLVSESFPGLITTVSTDEEEWELEEEK